uniref:Uncharacterized protein n=1 Tax=Hippocampus comes TaxID=109280 RepID=A0A3Q2YRU8_HIPCM
MQTVHQCNGACAEPDSDTEAVVGQGFKLGCISCKRRSEVKASATVEWYFKAKGEVDFVQVRERLLLLRCTVFIYSERPAVFVFCACMCAVGHMIVPYFPHTQGASDFKAL